MENNIQSGEDRSAPEKADDGSSGFIFDTASGFSVQEQQEILDKINSLSVEKGIVPQEGLLRNEAKKRGFLFPLMVNLIAFLLLGSGVTLLWFFHNRDDQEIRQGSEISTLTEQRLIQEIQRESNRRLGDMEQSQASLNAARDELARLSGEQERIAAAEALLGGYYTMIDRFIRAGDLDGAMGSLNTLREFLGDAVFLNNRSAETRRYTYLAAVNSLEDAITGILRNISNNNPAPSIDVENTLTQNTARIAELEQENQSQTRMIAALNSQGTGLNQIIVEYEDLIKKRESQISSQEQTLNQRDNTIQTIRTENAAQARQISDLNTDVAAARRQSQEMAQTITIRENRIRDLENENTALNNRNTTLTGENTSLNNRNTTLANENTALSNRNTTLANENTSLNNRNTALTNENTALTAENTELNRIRAELIRTLSGSQ